MSKQSQGQGYPSRKNNVTWTDTDNHATLEQYRRVAEEKRKKREEKRKSGKQGLHMTNLEIKREKDKIFSEYMRAPRDQKPTIKELAAKYNFCVNTVNKWFRARGISAKRRTP